MTIVRKLALAVHALLIVAVAGTYISVNAQIDPTFNASVNLNQNDVVSVIVTQPDGKQLIGGSFSVVDGYSQPGIARLNPDGTVDTAFNPPVFIDISTSVIGATIKAIALQSDGKILVGGRFYIQGTSITHIARLNPDGTLDTTFSHFSYGFSTEYVVNKIIVTAGNSFYIGGRLLRDRGDGWFNHQIIKFLANGAPDPTFQHSPQSLEVKDLLEQADGRVVFVDIAQPPTFPNIKRIHPNGVIDTSFGVFCTGGLPERVFLQPDGKILAVGGFSGFNGFAYNRIARINQDGTVDVNFNTNNPGASGGTVLDAGIAADGKIYIGGTFTQFNGVSRNRLARLNSDGTLDTTFVYTSASLNAFIRDIEVLASGKILIAGGDTAVNVPVSDTINRVNSDGSLDTTFITKAGKPGQVRKIVFQPDGKLVIGGDFNWVNGVRRNGVARLNTDGSLDTTFVPYFNTSPQAAVRALALQPDGKIVVGMDGGSAVFRRLNSDGTQDLTFTPPVQSNSLILDIAVQANGQIIAVGGLIVQLPTPTFRAIARFNANGTLDSGFAASQPNGFVHRVYLLGDGRMYIGGEFTSLGGSPLRGRIARLNSDGSNDASFNPPGGANAAVYDIDVQADGKVLLGGVFFSLNGSTTQGVGRLNSDGSLDNTFSQMVNVNVLAVKSLPDGKVLIGGQFTVVGGVPRSGIARLNANGSLDTSFTAGVLLAVSEITLQADGKIVIGGDFSRFNNVSKVGIARLLSSSIPARVLFDYDGDGRSDISVFRPSENKWYIFRSSDSVVSQTVFALAGDVPAPADYDGDGKTDVAIFRPLAGDWWYLASTDGTQRSVHWGVNGDIVRPSDFDGDGKADFVVFRPSNGVWYRFGSTGATSIVAFGLTGDKPVIGDFDGDGKSDPAIFRPSTGDWWYLSSINGAQIATHWGSSTDTPAPGDFDGDGKTDLAVYRPSNGGWYILNSSNGSFTITSFGLAEDRPVPADYDGDGRADIAVFRPSTGVWYLQRSTAGFFAMQFGVSTDTPTPNAFVP